MSFARILRSSALMGGAQVVVLMVAVIRNKVIAQLMGPAGVGLVGVLTAFNGNVSTMAAWGLGASGVRLIAASSEEEKAAKQGAVRKFGSRLSIIGLIAALVLFWPTAQLTFASGEYALELLLGGFAVPCIVAGSIWSSILQAAGHVRSLARAQILSALGGLVIGLPLIWLFGSIGIAASLLLAAAVPLGFTWLVARRDCLSAHEPVQAADLRTLFNMGGGLVIIGAAAQLAAYIVRLTIIRNRGDDQLAGLADAGYYQAAIAIAGSLPALVFGAMGTDFFPRVAATKDETEARLLSEKQIQAALLLAMPIFVGLITMGEQGVALLYADRFAPAIPLLTWMIWGVFCRLLGWPLGYWLVARGSMRTVIFVEVASNLAMASLPLLLMPWFGLAGAAIGFFAGYALYAIAMLVVVRTRCGQWLGAKTLGWFVAGVAALAISQIFTTYFPGPYWAALPVGITTAISFWVYRRALSNES
jgi:enterobacterial common antigen flippase